MPLEFSLHGRELALTNYSFAALFFADGIKPLAGCCKIIHHPCPPFFGLRGSLRGCRSEIRLLDLAPATILCAKDCWVKRRDGVVAAPPPLHILGVAREIAGRNLPFFPAPWPGRVYGGELPFETERLKFSFLVVSRYHRTPLSPGEWKDNRSVACVHGLNWLPSVNQV